jgi:mono/diheme cytochrome c family protein
MQRSSWWGLVAALVAAPALLAAAGAAAGGAEAGGAKVDRVLADMGWEYFQQYCAACHGEDGRGRGPAAGALKTPPADLTRIAARRGGSFPDGEVARFIDGRFAMAAHGTREMPVWGERFGERIPEAGVGEEVTRGRILVLVEYLKSIQLAD